MRTITTTIYLYNELPTEEAKEKSRSWWYELEMEDPAWHLEHKESRKAALEAFEQSGDDVPDITPWKDYSVTGYCGDGIFADFIKDHKDNWKDTTTRQVASAFAQAWKAELESRNEREYIEDSILSNEYEFLEDGSRA